MNNFNQHHTYGHSAPSNNAPTYDNPPTYDNQPPHSHQPPSKYMSVKSHGAKTAIGFEPDQTRSGWDTARIEAAAKLNPNSKAFDWENKITIQLTKSELPIVISVLLGYKKECKFQNHGESNKWFEIINQGSNFFVKVGDVLNKKLIVCPVPIVEAHLMGLLGLSQHTKNFDGLTSDAALSAIKVLASHLNKNA